MLPVYNNDDNNNNNFSISSRMFDLLDDFNGMCRKHPLIQSLQSSKANIFQETVISPYDIFDSFWRISERKNHGQNYFTSLYVYAGNF